MFKIILVNVCYYEYTLTLKHGALAENLFFYYYFNTVLCCYSSHPLKHVCFNTAELLLPFLLPFFHLSFELNLHATWFTRVKAHTLVKLRDVLDSYHKRK